MRRRRLLGALVAACGLLSGCGGPVAEVTERPTGEVDVTFRTAADRDVEVALELLDGEGRVVDATTSGVPPDQPGAPSFYAGGLALGPYALTVETEAGLRVERRCVATEPG